jgi:hypothetical protein
LAGHTGLVLHTGAHCRTRFVAARRRPTLTLTRGATTGAGARTSAVDAVGAVENASRDNRAAKPQTATSSWVVGKNSPPRVALALLC